jgi:glycosyltransferase involved in cell wall biosynthesis
MPRLNICFYVAVKDRSLFELVEFYRQDIQALQELGHDVRLASHPRQLRFHDDVYWVWWPTSGAPAILWAHLCGRPVVLLAATSDRDTSLAGLPAQAAWKRAAAKLSFQLADLTLVPSEDTRLGLHRYKVRALRTAPLAVDTDFYRPGSPPDGSPYMLTISHLTRDNVERKRLLDVVRTAAELRERHSQLRLVIVGGYEDGMALVEAEIARLDLHDMVTLAGRISAEEKRRLLQGASVYFQPSQYESFGVAIAEAMACGTPVVSNAVGAVPDVLGDAGVLLGPEATPAEFAAAVLELSARGSGTQAKRGRERVVKKFSYEARKEFIAETIQDVLTCRSTGTRIAED